MKDAVTVWQGQPVTDLLDLLEAVQQMMALPVDPGTVSLEGEMVLSVVRRTLTDGSQVHDLVIKGYPLDVDIWEDHSVAGAR